MKQQLWQINSFLLLILFATLIVSIILEQAPPLFREKKATIEQLPEKKVSIPKNLEIIYQKGIFGPAEPKKEITPAAQSLVEPIPELKSVTTQKPPELPKPEFLSPLNITIKGIAFSLDEEKSIAMIEDETKKEKVYHAGGKIKDSQLIKITRNRIILLRTNGQHETLLLRKDDLNEGIPVEKKWAQVIQKKDDKNFKIDINKFPQEIQTVGQLSEMLNLFTTYKQGKPIGIKIGNLNPIGIGPKMGLEKDDIITSINNISTSDKKNRIKIYDNISTAKLNSSIKLTAQRKDQTLEINYLLTEIKEPKPSIFGQPTEEKTDTDKKDDKKDELFKLSELQEREKRLQGFSQRHKQPQQQNTLDLIRQRLIENMKARSRNARIR